VIHFDICTVYDAENPEFGCSCGIPRLLAELKAALLGDLEPVPARRA
jgi:hypothetical protein